MISVNRLLHRVSDFPVQKWILDSAAFSRVVDPKLLNKSGRRKGHLSVRRYAALARRWSQCGSLLAVVAQDYLCTPIALQSTGLAVATHQRLGIHRYDRLCSALSGSGLYVMPTLQGWDMADYANHLHQWGDRLKIGDWVGVGSIAQHSNPEVEAIW